MVKLAEELKIKDQTIIFKFWKKQNLQELFDALLVTLTLQYGTPDYRIDDNRLVDIKFYLDREFLSHRVAVLIYIKYNYYGKIEKVIIDTYKIEGRNYFYNSDNMGLAILPFKIKELIKELSEDKL